MQLDGIQLYGVLRTPTGNQLHSRVLVHELINFEKRPLHSYGCHTLASSVTDGRWIRSLAVSLVSSPEGYDMDPEICLLQRVPFSTFSYGTDRTTTTRAADEVQP